MKFDYRKILPHILVLLGFVVISLAYFNPVLRGKVIFQSDIVQYTGMAKEQNDFRDKTGEEPYWTDAAFGGMPTYQLGAHYPNDFVGELDDVLRFLPRPADYLFLYFIGIYILLLVLKIDYKLAFLGALAFGFSTYFIVILGVGHNAKAHAISYMPWVLAGILLVLQKKRIWGFFLLALGMALEVNANHFQMTYYLFLLVLVLGIVYLIKAYKQKELPEFFKSIGIMVIAVALAIGTNITNLMATMEYTAFSTRGESDLTLDKNPENNSGLAYDYITEYSYGIVESFNLFIPRFMGGGNAEKLDKSSASYEALLQLGANPVQAARFIERAPTYWGDQPYVAAPAYIGATVFFFFVLALFLVKGRLKWWLVSGSIIALVLSWGDNFEALTRFFINYVPMYDKFRAVSSIQIIIELCVPVLGMLGLYQLFAKEQTKESKQYALKWTTLILGGLALIFLLLKSVLFDFSGANDAVYLQRMGADFVRALTEDRKAIFTADTIRSLVFVILSAGVVWLYLKGKLDKNKAIIGFAILILFDLVGVDRRYVNNADFVNAREMKIPFQPNAADKQIMKDDGHYRVLDLSVNPLNSARASYFHNSIGGYHGAKPRRFQDLYAQYISQGNQEILNMLNTKYFILNKKGKYSAQKNSSANGNAWFVDKAEVYDSTDKVFLRLGEINTKTTAVINAKFSNLLPNTTFEQNSSAYIRLKNYTANELTYVYHTTQKQLAVFSEIYYPHGWNAYVDGKKVPHFRADYVLRAMVLPVGTHEVVFKFEPQVVATGSTIVLITCVLLALLFVGALVYQFKFKKEKEITDKEA